jgi:hypothetical protein
VWLNEEEENVDDNKERKGLCVAGPSAVKVGSRKLPGLGKENPESAQELRIEVCELA